MMKTVFIIEDDIALRENTAELLIINGYNVITAKNGQEGFEQTEKNKPNIILCDVMMPESDGLAFLDLVKKDKATSLIPLIFFSAGPAPSMLTKGLTPGSDEFLSKPFSEGELLAAIKRVLPSC